jgi:hypothetical protein
MREMRATPDDLRKYGSNLGWEQCPGEDCITLTSPDKAVRVTIPPDKFSRTYEDEAREAIKAYAAYYKKDFSEIYKDIMTIY